jgi:hypothetical protein
MAIADEMAELELVKNHYEIHFKSANYLLAAHAAGLVGCLTVLKDYEATPQLKGMGTFFVLFGVGLLFSISNYIALVFARNHAHRPYERPSDKLTEKFLKRAHLGSLAIALLMLVMAIFLMMFRFARL